MNYNQNHHLKNGPCPKCQLQGLDSKGDNLATYSDGHQWCWSCGYYTNPNKILSYQSKDVKIDIKETPPLPYDCTIDIPSHALAWLEQYELSINTIKKNNILWSDSKESLIFPYFIKGELVAWQMRYCGIKGYPKWITKGKIEEIIYTLGNKSTSLVLVEDIISSIKVSQIKQCSPLFGSVITTKRLVRLQPFYDTLYIWLDFDKRKESINFAEKARLLGFTVYNIVTELDPKDYPIDIITNYINNNDKTRTNINTITS